MRIVVYISIKQINIALTYFGGTGVLLRKITRVTLPSGIICTFFKALEMFISVVTKGILFFTVEYRKRRKNREKEIRPSYLACGKMMNLHGLFLSLYFHDNSPLIIHASLAARMQRMQKHEH